MTNVTPWLRAPLEYTIDYMPVYQAVSKALQRALRSWASEWITAHPESLQRPQLVLPILLYSQTTPRAGYGWGFGVGALDREELELLARPAHGRMNARLKRIDKSGFPRALRERYYPLYSIRSFEKLLRRYRGSLVRLFNTDVVLMQAFLTFRTVHLAHYGADNATYRLRRALRLSLERFTHELHFGVRSEELLGIATAALEQAMTVSESAAA